MKNFNAVAKTDFVKFLNDEKSKKIEHSKLQKTVQAIFKVSGNLFLLDFCIFTVNNT